MQKQQKILPLLAILSILAYTLLGAYTPAYAAAAQLTVVVRDCETKKPIAEATVTITTADGAPSRKTNQNGQVVFKDIKPVDENHTVTVDATGFPRATAIKYLADGEAGGLSFCLRKAPPPTPTRAPTNTPLPQPTQPPVPTQAPIEQPPAGGTPAPGAEPGGEQPAPETGASVAQCPAALSKILSQQFGAEQGAALVPAELAQGACDGDPNPLCARDQIFKPVFANTGAFMVRQNVAREQVAQTAWSILSNPEGQQACGAARAYGLALAQQFSLAGLRLDFVGVQTTGRVLVTNADGQRAGMLDDGSVVEEIPGSKAGALGDRAYVLVPAGSMQQVALQGVSEGALTVDVVRTVGDGPGAYVDAASFENLPVSPAWKATLDVSTGEPELSVDAGDGQTQMAASTWIERNPVDAAGLAYWTGASAQPTAAPAGSDAAPATPAPAAGFNLRANLVPILLVGGGIGLVMVVVALGVVYFVFLRKRDRDDDEE